VPGELLQQSWLPRPDSRRQRELPSPGVRSPGDGAV